MRGKKTYDDQRHDQEEAFLDSGMWWTNANHKFID